MEVPGRDRRLTNWLPSWTIWSRSRKRYGPRRLSGPLAVLKKEEPAEYAKIKAELKGLVNLNDLERAVNKQIAENQKLRIVEPGDEPGTIGEYPA